MSKLQKKQEAIQLRKDGYSCVEIAKRLDISSSTASIWCRDIEMPEGVLEKFIARTNDARNKGRMIGAKRNKQLREERVREAELWANETIGRSLHAQDLLFLGIGLYWGEGSKGRKLSIANSNPGILIMIKRWFEQVLRVEKSDFMIRIYINQDHADRYSVVESYWVKKLRLPKQQFTRPTFIKAKQKKIYENRETYYGVATLTIRKSGQLQNQILGLIQAVQNAEVAQVVRASHS